MTRITCRIRTHRGHRPYPAVASTVLPAVSDARSHGAKEEEEERQRKRRQFRKELAAIQLGQGTPAIGPFQSGFWLWSAHREEQKQSTFEAFFKAAFSQITEQKGRSRHQAFL